MNPEVERTREVIERVLSKSPAYRKIDEDLYVVKQGSAYVFINVVPVGRNRAQARCIAQLVKGATLDCELATDLLRRNASLRFGAFAYDPDGDLILFLHSILGGKTLDDEELLATVRDVAVIADENDNAIAKRHGGQTMKDLLEEAALERLLAKEPERFFSKDKLHN